MESLGKLLSSENESARRTIEQDGGGSGKRDDGGQEDEEEEEESEENTESDDDTDEKQKKKRGKKGKKGEPSRLSIRYATYKVHQLDWYDVESRIKQICSSMVKPISVIATESKTGLERETKRLEKCLIDTEKLNNAVFF